MIDASQLNEGDKVTMDGLKVLTVVDTDATRGLGGTREGYEMVDENEDKDETYFKTERQMNVYFDKLN